MKSASSSQKMVLVVDDEKHIVRLAQVILEHAGYSVITASDGLQGLQIIETQMPDLVLLDVMMPNMDGFELLTRLRENDATHYLPVIMLTAKAQDNDLLRSWKAGVNLYLTKPFSPEELMLYVQNTIGVP